MKKNKKNNLTKKSLLLATSVVIAASAMSGMVINNEEVVNANSALLGDYVKSLVPGDILRLDGKEFHYVATTTEGIKVIQKEQIKNIQFDSRTTNVTTNVFSPTTTTNVGYYLNNTYYNSLSGTIKDMIVNNSTWNIGDSNYVESNEASKKVKATVGLLTRSEFEKGLKYHNANGKIPYYANSPEWSITPMVDDQFSYHNQVWYVSGVNGMMTYQEKALQSWAVRPAVVLKSNLYVDTNGNVSATPPNKAPVNNGTINAQTIAKKGETVGINLASYFQDADGDALTYTASSNATNKVSTSVSGSTLTLTGVDTGIATITVTATDPSGASVSQTFGVEVMAPSIVGPSEPSIDIDFDNSGDTSNGSNGSIDLDDYFDNTSPGDVIFTPNVLVNEAQADVSVERSSLIIKNAKKDGLVSVNVEAENSKGEKAQALFNLYVKADDNSNSNLKDRKVTMNLLEGEFTLKTSDINDFGKIKLTAAKQTVTTGFSGDFGVVDARGTQEGWNVTVSATPFTVETFEGFVGTPHQMPLGSLALNNPLNIERINHINTTDGLPTTGLSGYNILDNGAVPLLNANQGEGLGEFKFNFEDALALTVDAVTAKIDTVNYPEQDTPYVSTVTWDLVSGPQL